MLELQAVSKTFRETPVLDHLDLRIERGQTTALIGPSGCGKSTTLRLFIGLIVPDTGRVLFDGRLLDSDSLLEARRRTGYVIQEGGLFPHLTARANVTLTAAHLRWEPGRIAARLDELTELTSFPKDALDRYPAELSGGQRQRVALMRALLLDPDVLLLDEPLGALDPLIRFDLQHDLRNIFQRLGKTVVLVTHDLAEAAFFAGDLVLLHAGRVLQRGSLAEMVAKPADDFVARFVRAQHGRALAAEAAAQTRIAPCHPAR